MKIESLASIETSRLVLRPVGHRDAKALGMLLNQPSVARYNDYGDSLSQDDVISYIQGDIERMITGSGIRLVLLYKSAKELIGTVGIYDVRISTGNAFIGFELDERFRGRGLMKEALSELVQSIIPALYSGKVTTLMANIKSDNVASIALLTRCGFKKIPVEQSASDASTESSLFRLKIVN